MSQNTTANFLLVWRHFPTSNGAVILNRFILEQTNVIPVQRCACDSDALLHLYDTMQFYAAAPSFSASSCQMNNQNDIKHPYT